jgi:SAM-dependent methyltransferase
MDRNVLLRSQFDTRGSGLEVGPSYNPLLPKAAGYRVETADYLDAAGLRAKYAGANVNLNAIEEVDHVIGDSGLAASIGKQGCYDYIVASHVIEHTPDLIGFLRECESLLRPEGVLVLAVPDKRCCFDIFQSLTSLGAVVQAYLERRTRPGPAQIIDDRAYNAVRGGAIGWSLGAKGPLTFFLDLPTAVATFGRDRTASHYIDVHVWKFVPSSFRLLIGDLAAFGFVGLRERSFADTMGNEFFVTLAPNGTGCGVDRLELARRAVREQARIAVD